MPVSDTLVQLCVEGFVAGLLVVQCVRYSNTEGKLPQILLFVQLVLCLARNMSILAQGVLSSSDINCVGLGIAGLMTYTFWAIALDYVLYVRARVFTNHPNTLGYAVHLLWLGILAVRFYTATTYQDATGTSKTCKFTYNQSTNVYSFALRCIIEILVLVPFVVKAIQTYRSNYSSRSKWLYMSITNVLATLGIIMIECLVTLGTYQNNNWFGSYTAMTFVIANFVESQLVLFVMEEMKANFSKSKSEESKTSRHVLYMDSNQTQYKQPERSDIRYY
ncbi:hypothetical protein EDD86DRAFT_212959 [Gorgonomyces haynaldii]|nr:hypothetical protein EDD86DRAFT_212959 [Gorgonomyces haynaldii]